MVNFLNVVNKKNQIDQNKNLIKYKTKMKIKLNKYYNENMDQMFIQVKLIMFDSHIYIYIYIYIYIKKIFFLCQHFKISILSFKYNNLLKF